MPSPIAIIQKKHITSYESDHQMRKRDMFGVLCISRLVYRRKSSDPPNCSPFHGRVEYLCEKNHKNLVWWIKIEYISIKTSKMSNYRFFQCSDLGTIFVGSES